VSDEYRRLYELVTEVPFRRFGGHVTRILKDDLQADPGADVFEFERASG